MKRLIMSFALLLMGIFLFAQNYGELKGRVLDDNNLPLSAARLNVVETDVFSFTDNNGFYSVKKLIPGDYTLEVSYFGYADQTISFHITENQTTILDIHMERGINLSDIQVVGSLTGTARALNQQRNMVNVGNIISSEQVNQFPDDNMGDALKRVPGVNVQYDQGEARFGNIRGTAPDLSAVTLDGDRLPSAEGETRAFQLDLIPADLVQSIEVNKVVTPDMDGDAIGASVNLVTRSIPDARRVRVDLSGGYNTIRDKANYKAGVLYADRVLDNKLGFTLTGSVFNNFIGSENYEAEWAEDGGVNDAIYAEDYQIRKYDLQRLRQNYTAAVDYKFNQNHRIEVSGSYNQRDDYENRMRLRYKKIKWDDKSNAFTANIERETKGGTEKDARLERQKLKHIKINGEHDFKFMELDWGLVASSASEERPNERYVNMASEDVQISQDISNARKVKVMPINAADSDIHSFEFDELTEEYQWTEEKNKTAYLNLNFPLQRGEYSNDLKVGIKFKSKDKERDNDFYKYDPLDKDAFTADALNHTQDYSDNDFEAINLPIGQFVNPAFLGGLNLNNKAFEAEQDKEELAGNYAATEDVQAAYVRFDQHIGDKWFFVGGLRVEKTNIEYNGFITDIRNKKDLKKGEDEVVLHETGKMEKDYTNLMPSILIKYSPAKLWNIKLGITNTIARPKYFDLVPYQIKNQKDNEIEVGNPALDPTKSFNVDLMFEKYFKNIGLVEAGVFYKDITDFIVDERYTDFDYNGNTWDKFKRPINGGDATLVGVEIGFQRPLDFIAPQLKAFSIYTNYTYIHSKINNFNIEDREDDDLTLSGTPEHTLNASLAYNTPKVEARLSYNHASNFIDEFGESSFYDRYYDAVDYLDFNVGYNFSDKINAYAKINNMLNQPLRYFQGEEDRTMQVEYYGVKYKVGVQINL